VLTALTLLIAGMAATYLTIREFEGRRYRTAYTVGSSDVRPGPSVDSCMGRYVADAEFIG
jgi:hypothetical protein